MSLFGALLRRYVEDYGGTKGQLARAVGIGPSAFSRLLRAVDPLPPSVELCLRIAKATGGSASALLRAAGKGDIADLIESLYGETAATQRRFNTLRITPAEEEFIRHLRTIHPKDLKSFMAIGARLPTADTRKDVRRAKQQA